MAHEDGFGYAEALGRAVTIHAIRILAGSVPLDVRVELMELELELMSPAVAGALAYLESRRKAG